MHQRSDVLGGVHFRLTPWAPHLADDRREDQLHLLLTGDAAYDISAFGMGVVRGLDALIALFGQRPGDQPLGHHVTNVIVSESDDGSATVRSKGPAVMADGTTSSLIYEDIVVRTDAGWRISRRTVIPPRTDAPGAEAADPPN